MPYTCRKKCFFPLMCFVFALSRPPAEQKIVSRQESAAVAKSLGAMGYSTELQPLVVADGQHFPQNILVTFSAYTENSVKEYSTQDTVILAFTQDFAFAHEDAVRDILRELSAREFPCTVQVLFSANDSNIRFLKERAPPSLSGTDVFVQNIMQTESIRAIVFDDEDNFTERNKSARTRHITAGARSGASPAWLVRAVRSSFSKNSLDAELPRSFGYLYEKGIYPGSRRLDAFLSQEIQAAGVSISGTAEDVRSVCDLVESVASRRASYWDRHYSFLAVGRDGIWTGEAFYAVLYIIFVLFTLGALNFYPVLRHKRYLAVQKDFRRSFFVIPSVILASAALLQIGQAAFRGLLGVPALFIACKCLLPVFLIMAAMEVQVRMQFRVSSLAMGQQMILMSSINLYFFCVVDISLIFIFFAEYLMAVMLRKTGSPVLNLLGFFMLFIPFIPFTASLLRYADQSALAQLFYGNFMSNLLLSCVLFVFFIQWQKTCMAFTLASRGKSFAVILGAGTAACIIALYALFSVSQLSAGTVRENDVLDYSALVAESDDDDAFQITGSRSEFLDLSTHRITLSSPNSVARYSLRLECEDNAIPLYESNYEYSFSNSVALFTIPDFPSGDLEVIFSTDARDCVLYADCWTFSGEVPFYHSRKVLRLESAGDKS